MDTAKYLLTQLECIPAEVRTIIILIYFVYGCIVGSFLNVCIIRIPKGQSVVRPGSHCKCGKPIKWYDNIPVLSWCLLRGKSRCCHSRISAAYPLVEAIVGLQWLIGGLCLFCTPSLYAIPAMLVICILGPIITYFTAVKLRIFK